jgi:hypothetical protein
MNTKVLAAGFFFQGMASFQRESRIHPFQNIYFTFWQDGDQNFLQKSGPNPLLLRPEW